MSDVNLVLRMILVWSLLAYVTGVKAVTDRDKLVDPTRPPGVTTANQQSAGKHVAPRWVLTSILIGKDRRQARINGQLVRIGQQINGARVENILATEVWLKNEQKRFKISLLAANIKEISKIADKE